LPEHAGDALKREGAFCETREGKMGKLKKNWGNRGDENLAGNKNTRAL